MVEAKCCRLPYANLDAKNSRACVTRSAIVLLHVILTSTFRWISHSLLRLGLGLPATCRNKFAGAFYNETKYLPYALVDDMLRVIEPISQQDISATRYAKCLATLLMAWCMDLTYIY